MRIPKRPLSAHGYLMQMLVVSPLFNFVDSAMLVHLQVK